MISEALAHLLYELDRPDEAIDWMLAGDDGDNKLGVTHNQGGAQPRGSHA